MLGDHSPFHLTLYMVIYLFVGLMTDFMCEVQAAWGGAGRGQKTTSVVQTRRSSHLFLRSVRFCNGLSTLAFDVETWLVPEAAWMLFVKMVGGLSSNCLEESDVFQSLLCFPLVAMHSLTHSSHCFVKQRHPHHFVGMLLWNDSGIMAAAIACHGQIVSKQPDCCDSNWA